MNQQNNSLIRQTQHNASTAYYVLFDLMDESVIVTRDEQGQVRALANVCRHRGSRVCLEQRGHTKRFTCPYHAWSYNLDGSLFHARLLDPAIDTTKLGLKPVSVEVVYGLIFVSLAERPASFDRVRTVLDPVLKVFELDRLKVAHRASYPVAANWKLLVENYNECYHCTAAHPEFSRSHSIHLTADRVAPQNKRMQARATECGVSAQTIDHIGQTCPSNTPDHSYNRYALFDGYVTGSEDGKPLAPLLGSLTGYDGGASDLYLGILNPMLIYSDHMVIYRFLPVDEAHSVQEIFWLVRDDAQEGKDYDLNRLTWLWDVTTQADKHIIEKNQQGVNSRFYEPGPFVSMEAYTRRFIETYLTALRRRTETAR